MTTNETMTTTDLWNQEPGPAGPAALAVSRVIPASREAVWQAWTDAGQLARWCTPRAGDDGWWAITSSTREPVTAGAAFESLMEAPALGLVCGIRGEYAVVEPMDRLVFSQAFGDGAGHWGDPVTVTVVLRDHPAGTRVTVTSRGVWGPDDMQEQGWMDVLEHLGEHLGSSPDQAREVWRAARSVAPPGETLVRTRRWFRAAPALVQQAWTSPQHLPNWWGPADYRCETERIDLREGGDWVFTMTGPHGAFPNWIRFEAIRPGRMDFLLGDAVEDPNAYRCFVLFEEAGEGTRLTLEMQLPDAAARDGAVEMGALELGVTTLDKLGAAIGEG